MVLNREGDFSAAADASAVQLIGEIQGHGDSIHRVVLAIFDLDGDGSSRRILFSAAAANSTGEAVSQRTALGYVTENTALG